jgi:hypothetical protein
MSMSLDTEKIIRAISIIPFVEITNYRFRGDDFILTLESKFHSRSGQWIHFYLICPKKPCSSFDKYHLVADGFKPQDLSVDLITKFQVSFRGNDLLVKRYHSLNKLGYAIADLLQVLIIIDDRKFQDLRVKSFYTVYYYPRRSRDHFQLEPINSPFVSPGEVNKVEHTIIDATTDEYKVIVYSDKSAARETGACMIFDYINKGLEGLE